MLSTFAQKLAIPLSFVLSLTTAPAVKVKSVAATPGRAPSYESQLRIPVTQFPTGDLSKTLSNFSGSITAIGTDSTTIMVASANGNLNLLHPSGWTEDLTIMLGLTANESARINAVAWNVADSYWLVGGAVTTTATNNLTSKPLLVKLVPNGSQTQNLRLEAQKFKAGEITDIVCRINNCLITSAPGKILNYDGTALTDISTRFGFIPELAPVVASNDLVWIIGGVIRDAIDGRLIATMYSYDGKNARLVSGDYGFTMRTLPAMSLAPNADGSAWLAMAHDGMLHAWVLDGAEFTPVKNFPKDQFIVPVVAPAKNGWVVGGSRVAKNIWVIDKNGTMTPGIYPDVQVTALLDTSFGTFVGGSTTLTTGNTTPALIRTK